MVQPPQDTRADGGSARSQAADLPERAWRPRPAVARAIRGSRTVFGLLTAVAAVRVAAGLVARPAGTALTVLWLLSLAAVSVVTVTAVDRITRRLLPVAALYQLSLVFPDQAPSRFGHALRGGWTRPREHGSEAGPASDTGTVQSEAERLLALVHQLTAHDRRTRGHTERVRAYARLIGEEIGLDPDSLEKLNWGALLHDIGKLDVPCELLNKPGQPTADEWAVLRRHPEHAAHYIEPLRPWLGDWLDAATQHHERIDGRGYPHGLTGDQIALSARIVAIADAYDVMTSARSYKSAQSAAQARAELTLAAGTQFDPALVRAFLRVSVGRVRWILGPLGWLSQLPSVLQIPLSTAVTVGGTAVLSLSPIVPTMLSDAWAPPAAPVEVAAAPVPEPEPSSPAGSGEEEPPSSLPRADPEDATPTAPPTVPTSEPSTDTAPEQPAPTEPVPAQTAVPEPVAEPDEPVAPDAATTTASTAASTTTSTNPPGNPAVDDEDAIRTGRNQVFQVTANDLFAAFGHNVGVVTIVRPPALGTASVVGPNIQYVAGAEPGSDALVYRVCSTTDWCGEATLSIEVG